MNGLYIGAMGMMAYQEQLNTASNNIANSQTNGYKFDTMVSTVYETMQAVRKSDDSGVIGVNADKVVNVNSPINWTEGNYLTSSSSLDLALMDNQEGQTSFFVIQNEKGTFLTRNGEFEVNEFGELKTNSGEFVLDTNGDKIVLNDTENIEISSDGTIAYRDGDVIAKLQVKTVLGDDRSKLVKSENGKFEYKGDFNNLNAAEFEINQGMVETSNVSMSNQLVELMNAQRKFQASSKIVDVFNGVYEKAANKLI